MHAPRDDVAEPPSIAAAREERSARVARSGAAPDAASRSGSTAVPHRVAGIESAPPTSNIAQAGRGAGVESASPQTNVARARCAEDTVSRHSAESGEDGGRVARRIDGPDDAGSRRPAWRQQLVEAERGMALGLRGGSALFVHFFSGSVIAAAGLVLGLDLLEWAIISLACTGVVSLELFHAMLRTLAFRIGPDAAEETRAALRIGTAAVFVAIVGCLTTVGLVLGRHLNDLAPP